MDRDELEVHKKGKNERSQHPANLTEQAVSYLPYKIYYMAERLHQRILLLQEQREQSRADKMGLSIKHRIHFIINKCCKINVDSLFYKCSYLMFTIV